MTWTILKPNELSHYRDIWNQLNRSGSDSAVLHTDFIAPLLREFGNGSERLAIYENAQAPVCLALLTTRRFGVWETFQPSQLPVGPWLNQSDLPLPTLLKSLSKALPGPVFNLAITQQDPDIYSRPAPDSGLDTLDYITTARVRITEPFADYWSRRGKNLRQNIKRQNNRLVREGMHPRLEIITDPNQVADAIAAYGELEIKSWKSQGGTAIHASNAQGRFYTAMMQNFCGRGDGYIYQYWYNDQLVATDLCVRQNGVLIVLKTTYDESITTSSPAMLLRRGYFEMLFDQGLADTIEFYGQVMDWHTKLTDDIRTLYHINYYPWPVANLLRLSAKLRPVQATG